MKKIMLIFTVTVLLAAALCGCAKPENRADVSVKSGETEITGTVEKVSGNILLISDGEGGRFSFCYSDEVEVVEDGYYVVDLSANSFKGKKVTVICSAEIMETYPAQLSGERMIIIG